MFQYVRCIYFPQAFGPSKMRMLHVMIQHLTRAIGPFLETVIYLFFEVNGICVPCIMPVCHFETLIAS